jgi:threonine dehydratase
MLGLSPGSTRNPAEADAMITWPISLAEVQQAHARIRHCLPETPLRGYGNLDAEAGEGIRVLVKHENHNPTNCFKARNGMAALSALTPEQRAAGVITGTRGNHGQALAWAGAQLGIPVTLCVPLDNNQEKNEAMSAYGAELIERGADYDEAVEIAHAVARERGLHVVHSTNDRQVLCGAATLAVEILERAPDVEALVVSVGGGSQALGALTAAREMRPQVKVWGVQAAAAPTIHDSWHAGETRRSPVQPTIADGLATRDVYELTFGSLLEGLAGFVTVTEAELATAIRMILRTTHNLVEAAGAAGLAGLLKLRRELKGKTAAIILSGGNIDQETLRKVMNGEL